MNKVMRLVSIQLWAVLGDMLSIGKNRKKAPKLLYVGIIAFIILMSLLSFMYNMMIGLGFKLYNSLELLPAMIMGVTCMVILMTTIFKIKGIIFAFRDYDMVMSLPVSTGAIVASRLIILYALNFLFVIIMMIPMLIAYGILAKPDFMFYIIGFTTIFIVPFIPIVIASFLGTLIAYAASRFRHSNVLNIIFTLGLLSFIIGASFQVKDNGRELLDIGKALTKQMNSIYPLAHMYATALIDHNILDLLLFVGISLSAFFLYTLFVKRIFKRMNTLIMTGSYHVNYKMGQLKTSSPLKALYFKELKRYFSSTLYVLNTGLGIVMLTIAAIALMFMDLDKMIGDKEAVDAVKKIVPIGISFCVIMTCTTMASISLEGKNIWIIKSLPIAPKSVYLSKIAVNLTVISPAILDIIIIGIALQMDILHVISIILVTLACSIFIALYGLLINLLLPNLNWSSEVVVIKQSAATLVTIFSAMGYVGLQFVFVMMIPSGILSYLGCFVFTLVLDAILYFVIMTYGNKRYFAL